ncbi:MAG TPA: type III pantothenate kinase [Usitatibacter sp.]|nr:type III pantothenate kinase [Usitatibacter sp.]
MILAIDAGNTRVKWGVHDGVRFVATGAVANSAATGLAEHWRGQPPVKSAIASNVAGPGLLGELQAACEAIGARLRVIRSEAEQLGVRNGYAAPGQLGTDRWAALVAAHRLQGGHKLVVNAGTALTVDALTAEGRFLGGVIVPGPALMRRALDRGTAALREAPGTFAPFPRSTPDAIASGAIQACVGSVRQLADAMAASGAPPAHVLLSGGAAPEIAPHLPIPFVIHENLVLEGLVFIARET